MPSSNDLPVATIVFVTAVAAPSRAGSALPAASAKYVNVHVLPSLGESFQSTSWSATCCLPVSTPGAKRSVRSGMRYSSVVDTRSIGWSPREYFASVRNTWRSDAPRVETWASKRSPFSEQSCSAGRSVGTDQSAAPSGCLSSLPPPPLPVIAGSPYCMNRNRPMPMRRSLVIPPRSMKSFAVGPVGGPRRLSAGAVRRGMRRRAARG